MTQVSTRTSPRRPTSATRPSGRAAGSRLEARKSGRARDVAKEASGQQEERPPRQITLRSIGLVLVFLVAFIVLAPTLRAYISQQEQLRDINGELAETNAEISALEAELERWNDPDYVRQQARDRFSYVEPGETAYRVLDPETVTGEDPVGDLTAEGEDATGYASRETGPWYSTLWESVEIAGAAEDALGSGEE